MVDKNLKESIDKNSITNLSTNISNLTKALGRTAGKGIKTAARASISPLLQRLVV
tara:strand:- start:156 stop:320 length:165 start_codon:yes stop_codon:yes gene_type:complete